MKMVFTLKRNRAKSIVVLLGHQEADHGQQGKTQGGMLGVIFQ
jgi:hypothetical protein